MSDETNEKARKSREFVDARIDATIKPILERIGEIQGKVDKLREDFTSLEKDLDAAFEKIFRALDDLGAPPSQEESPVLAEIMERLDRLEDGMDRLYKSERM